MSSIKIDKLTFFYNNNLIFNNLNFELPNNKSLSIVGACGSGKTTLLKILNGDIKNYKGNVIIEKNEDSSNKIRVVFDELPDDILDIKDFLFNDVVDLENDTMYSELNTYFNIDNIMNKKYDECSLEEKYLIIILNEILSKPSILALDNILIYLNRRMKVLLLNYLNYKKIQLINVTSDMEDVIFTDYMIVLYDGVSAIDGPVLNVLSNEKIIKRLGFSLPFMIDLSIQLQLYDLIDKIYLNKEMLVKALWK